MEQLYGNGRIFINFKPSKTPRYKFVQQHSFDPQRADDMDRLRSRLRDAHDATLDAVGSLALQPLWALNYNEGEYSNSVSHYPEVRLMRTMGALLQAHGDGASLAEPAVLAGKVDFLLRLKCGATLRLQAKTMARHSSHQQWVVRSSCYSDTDFDVLIVADFERNGLYFCPWRVAHTFDDGFDLFFSPQEMRAGTLYWKTIKDQFEPFFITFDAAGCEKMLEIAAHVWQDGVPAPPSLLPPLPLSEDVRQHEMKRIAATDEAMRCKAIWPTLAERDAEDII